MGAMTYMIEIKGAGFPGKPVGALNARRRVQSGRSQKYVDK
jgi:hypothetical protein